MTSLKSFRPLSSANRLVSIDSLRGGAALAVVIMHATNSAPSVGGEAIPTWLRVVLALICSYGFTGVFLFFVISGFCIHMRWAKAKSLGQEADVDFVAFWRRRLARLYPTYIIALFIYIAILSLQGKVNLTFFTLFDIVVHLLMLHNINENTVYSISGVFWTLAIEEQLYLLYFAFVFFRSKWGLKKSTLICFLARPIWFALCMIAHRLLHLRIPVTESAIAQWCIWALGAVSVESWLGIIKLPRWCRDIRIMAFVMMIAAAAFYIDRSSQPTGLYHEACWLLLQPIWGLAFFIMVNHTISGENKWKGANNVPRVASIFAYIGTFSYSLYLTHEIVLVHLSSRVSHWFGRSPSPTFLLALTPICVIFAWIFFVFFERPFLPLPQVLSIPIDQPVTKIL